jgi:hypothetical protein
VFYLSDDSDYLANVTFPKICQSGRQATWVKAIIMIFLVGKADMRRKKTPAVPGDFRKKRYTILANGCRAFGKGFEAVSRPRPETAAPMLVTT